MLHIRQIIKHMLGYQLQCILLSTRGTSDRLLSTCWKHVWRLSNILLSRSGTSDKIIEHMLDIRQIIKHVGLSTILLRTCGASDRFFLD